MKNPLLKFVCYISLFFFLTSCGTMFGGSKYYAHVNVEGHPDAMIYTKSVLQGKGNAIFSVRRKDANKFAFRIVEEGCDEQSFKFKKRTFRGWAFVGSLAGFTGTYGGVPLPWGIVVDLANGALWKPSLAENGVSKINNKHYNYNVKYEGCKERDSKQIILYDSKQNTMPESQDLLIDKAKKKADRLREMKKLLDEGILTQEEYEKEKKKILDEQ